MKFLLVAALAYVAVGKPTDNNGQAKKVDPVEESDAFCVDQSVDSELLNWNLDFGNTAEENKMGALWTQFQTEEVQKCFRSNPAYQFTVDACGYYRSKDLPLCHGTRAEKNPYVDGPKMVGTTGLPSDAKGGNGHFTHLPTFQKVFETNPDVWASGEDCSCPSGPEETTTEPIPVVTTTEPIPVVTTTEPIPVVTTTEPIPVVTTTETTAVEEETTAVEEETTAVEEETTAVEEETTAVEEETTAAEEETGGPAPILIPEEDPDPEDQGVPVGAIAGGVVGGAALVGAGCLMAYKALGQGAAPAMAPSGGEAASGDVFHGNPIADTNGFASTTNPFFAA